MIKHLFYILLVITILSCNKSSYHGELLNSPPLNDSNSDQFWQRSDSLNGISEESLRDHIQLCINTGASSQIVIYKGKIVSEWYSDSYAEPLGAMSSTKVITSLAIGLLADKGKLKYTDLFSSIIPEWSGGYRDLVTIEQLLTHSSGIKRRLNSDESIGFTPQNKTKFVLDIEPDYNPGVKFSYSNEGTQLLEPVIDKLSEVGTEDFIYEKLFKKIGMNNSKLYSYGGSPWLYAELRTTTRDLARVGLLMANNGFWNGSKIISEGYIKRATSPSEKSKEMGYLWWLFNDKSLPGYYASGYLNNDIYVFPDWDIVVVRTQSPKNGYSGKNESKNYFNNAKKIFRRLVK